MQVVANDLVGQPPQPNQAILGEFIGDAFIEDGYYNQEIIPKVMLTVLDLITLNLRKCLVHSHLMDLVSMWRVLLKVLVIHTTIQMISLLLLKVTEYSYLLR